MAPRVPSDHVGAIGRSSCLQVHSSATSCLLVVIRQPEVLYQRLIGSIRRLYQPTHVSGCDWPDCVWEVGGAERSDPSTDLISQRRLHKHQLTHPLSTEVQLKRCSGGSCLSQCFRFLFIPTAREGPSLASLASALVGVEPLCLCWPDLLHCFGCLGWPPQWWPLVSPASCLLLLKSCVLRRWTAGAL